jgi:hypothetical protein
VALFNSVAECKLTWAKLCSYYRKALHRRETTNGQAAEWCFWEQMQFLLNHFQKRE